VFWVTAAIIASMSAVKSFYGATTGVAPEPSVAIG
jgi:hypothetical protein